MTTLKTQFSGTINGRRFENAKAELYKGKPLADPPKNYTKVGLVSCFAVTDLLSKTNHYNSNLATIYQNKQGKFYYEIYRDGCFYPYYGLFSIEKEV